MGFWILLLVLFLVWGAVYCKLKDFSIIELVMYALVSFVLLGLVISIISLEFLSTESRDVAVDNITLIGDSYIVEYGETTKLFKQGEVSVEIGEKNFVKYSKEYSKENWFSKFFGYANENEIKESSDKEFIEDSEVVLIGIDKESIKWIGRLKKENVLLKMEIYFTETQEDYDALIIKLGYLAENDGH